MTYDPEAVVDYKLAVIDALREKLATERTDTVVMMTIEGGNEGGPQFYTLLFSLDGEILERLDGAWLRTSPGAHIDLSKEHHV